MKIDIVEKVGEITITELRSAKENRAISNEAQKLLAEKKRIEEEKKRIEKEKKRIETLKKLPHIMECINKIAQNGQTTLYFEWYTSKNYTSNGVTWEEWKILKDTFNSHLGSLGYTMRDYEYSTAWQKKSNKLGYGSISW